MSAVVFIGDELSACGFRLTGIETLVPPPGALESALEEARMRASLVIMTADLARRIPAQQLETAMLTEMPTVAIIPDVLFRVPMPDLISRIKSILGIET